MNSIYNFENQNPPILNENIIRAKIEKRKLKRQTTLLALAGILLQICTILVALLVAKTMPTVAIFMFLYCIVSITGGSVITIIFTYNRRSITCQS